MSTETTPAEPIVSPVVAPKTPKVTKAKTPLNPKSKPTPKKDVKPVAKERSIWTELRLKVAKALLKAGATSQTTAINREAIAKKTGLSLYQAGHHTYQTEALFTAGYIKFADMEDTGRCVYLTKEGVKALSSAV